MIHVVRCHDLVEEGLIAEACEQLADAANRLDGEPRPPEFIAEGSDPLELQEIRVLVQQLANRHGWRLVSVSESLDTGTPAGRFTLTILAALAQLEREQTAERTRVSLAHVARQGRARSRFVPFGWRTAAGSVEQEKGD